MLRESGTFVRFTPGWRGFIRVKATNGLMA
jgi:hypothetical protein